MSSRTNRKEQSIFDAYESYFRELLSYGLKIINNKDIVADCIHDLFVELHQKKTIDTISELKPYLFRCLRNLLLDNLKSKPNVSLDRIENQPFEFSTREELWVREEMDAHQQEKLRRALEELTARQKEVIYLRLRDELSYQQIADITGITNQSVRNHFSIAIKHLRECLSSTLVLSTVLAQALN